MVEGLKLTKETHQILKDRGYQYLLIKAVGIDTLTGRLNFLRLSPLRHMRSTNMDGCTGIDDGMILSLLNSNLDIDLSLTDHKEII